VNDLLKRLAEIEGWDKVPYSLVSTWNPLTNDAQALGLVKKYLVDVYRLLGGWEVLCDHESGDAERTVKATHKDLNTAICMAVVEAYK